MAKKRKSGTGTVRQRSDGRWEGRVVIGYDDNGLPKTKNVLAKTKRECQEKLRQLTESMVGRNDRKVKSDMLFGDWLCYWYENHSKPTLRASTQNNYENVIHNHVLPEIGKISLHKLSQNDLVQNKHSLRGFLYASDTMLILYQTKNKKNSSEINDFRGILVRVVRLERTVSWSQSRRATNCATPGY